MRLALLVLLLAVPGAQACSLASMPFGQARFHDDGLWYVADGSLRHVVGTSDTLVEDAFFLSYARLQGGRLLVAGQDGLGGACEGDDWLELRDGARVLWRKELTARVFDVPGGPYLATRAASEDEVAPRTAMDLWRLEGDELVRLGQSRAPPVHVVGMTATGDPIESGEDGFYLGDRFVPKLDGYAHAAAATADATTLVEAGQERVRLHVLAGDLLATTSWSPPGGWSDGVTATDAGWLVAAGGRAYLVGSAVTDLGLDAVSAVASRGGDPVVFTQDGYVIFDGLVATEAWRRDDGLWRPAPVPDLRPVETPAQRETSQPETRPTSAPAGGTFEVPMPGLLVALAVAALAAVRRRR